MANPLTKIPKFRRCVLQNFPFIEQDFDALTDYQLLCKVVEYLNKVITSQNGVIDITESLTIAFNQLHDFVEDYFENLDVQEEINNKLDQMAEDGTLQEIITTYIQSNVAWTFDTVADMKLATNLVDGSYARTLGFRTINDGGGATYYINDSGTANEMDIIAVDTLKAHLVLPAKLSPEMIGANGDGLTDDTAYFARACELSNSILIDKSYVISSTTIPNGTKISGDGTIIATSITVGANTIIDGINITVPENATAFVINNLGSTSSNNDIFNNLTFICNSGSTCFNIYPTHTNSGLYNVRFNNITASGNYNKFIDINNNSKWVTAISISNVYAGSPKNVLANNNNIDNVSYVSGIELFNVKSQANSNTEHFITTNAGKLFLYGCNVDELNSYSYKMIYINNNKAKVLVSGISSMTNLVGSSLYNDHTALALNIIVDNVVDANEFNQVLLSEISNAGNAESAGPFIGVGSLVSLNVDSTRISGMQITPGSRVSTDGRSFLLGFNNSGVPHYADVKNGNYYEIPYTGKLKTYSTANRPATANNGDCIFDTTLKQPIYWYGKWLKYDGTDA